MELKDAADRILLGESLQSIASHFRAALMAEMGMDPEESPPDLFRKETLRYMNEVCRHLGERHSEDRRVAIALRAWIRFEEEYDAFDVLLSNYNFEQRPAVLRRGRFLFPSTLTSHWAESAAR